jgi:hypothetical protein
MFGLPVLVGVGEEVIDQPGHRRGLLGRWMVVHAGEDVQSTVRDPGVGRACVLDGDDTIRVTTGSQWFR